jgi:hypothetical protein
LKIIRAIHKLLHWTSSLQGMENPYEVPNVQHAHMLCVWL